MNQNTKIYVIYASADSKLAVRLLNRLRSIEKSSNISIWDDDVILENEVWKPQDDIRIAQANLFLLLISNAFMHSEFIKQLEFKNIIDRYKEGTATVIPIILENCEWQITFESDDYNFNLNELQVLPEGGKAVANWSSSKKALASVLKSLKELISPAVADSNDIQKQEPDQVTEELAKEEQMAMDFVDPEKAASQIADEKSPKRAAQSKKSTEPGKINVEPSEADLKAQAGKKSKEVAEAQLKIEKAKKLAAEEAAKKKAKQQELLQAAEKQTKSEKKSVAQAQQEAQPDRVSEDAEGDDFAGIGPIPKKKLLASLLAAALVVVAIVLFSGSTDEIQEEPQMIPENVEVKGPVAPEKIEAEVPKKEEELTLLSIGEIYDGGFVFEISQDGKTGKMAHIDDAGPMPWSNAMEIHKELGEGWRLPTMEELQLMRKTIGQGANNSGEFSDGLYWSATPYSEFEAKLLRFRDGNSTYHYNSGGTHRNFRVRAIRDFKR